MFLIAFIVGVVVAIAMGVGFPAALVGGVVAVVIAFVGQAVVGLESMRRGRAAVPVDLDAATPDPLTQEVYERLPLAARNALVAGTVATATGRPVEAIAGLLPEMMGRSRISNLASQRGALYVMESLDPTRLNRATVSAILEGELAMAARAAMPPTDRARAIAERNLGAAVTPDVMRQALLTTRFPRIGRASTAELMAGALDGDVDLAFVVGLIRKVGEKHQKSLAELGN